MSNNDFVPNISEPVEIINTASMLMLNCLEELKKPKITDDDFNKLYTKLLDILKELSKLVSRGKKRRNEYEMNTIEFLAYFHILLLKLLLDVSVAAVLETPSIRQLVKDNKVKEVSEEVKKTYKTVALALSMLMMGNHVLEYLDKALDKELVQLIEKMRKTLVDNVI